MLIVEYRTRSVLIEYYLDGNSWFEVNRKTRKGKVKNIQINEAFAIE